MSEDGRSHGARRGGIDLTAMMRCETKTVGNDEREGEEGEEEEKRRRKSRREMTKRTTEEKFHPSKTKTLKKKDNSSTWHNYKENNWEDKRHLPNFYEKTVANRRHRAEIYFHSDEEEKKK